MRDRVTIYTFLSVWLVTLLGLQAQDTEPAVPAAKPDFKKVLLRVPIENGEKFLTVSAMVHEDITEITLTPVIEQNKVVGARIVSLDQDHTIRATGDSLVLDLPTGQVTVGGTFAITSKSGRPMFAVKLDGKDEIADIASNIPIPNLNELPRRNPGQNRPPLNNVQLPTPDERIKAILQPEETQEE